MSDDDKRIYRYVAEEAPYKTGSKTWRVYDRQEKDTIADNMTQGWAILVAELLNK